MEKQNIIIVMEHKSDGQVLQILPFSTIIFNLQDYTSALNKKKLNFFIFEI